MNFFENDIFSCPARLACIAYKMADSRENLKILLYHENYIEIRTFLKNDIFSRPARLAWLA